VVNCYNKFTTKRIIFKEYNQEEEKMTYRIQSSNQRLSRIRCYSFVCVVSLSHAIFREERERGVRTEAATSHVISITTHKMTTHLLISYYVYQRVKDPTQAYIIVYNIESNVATLVTLSFSHYQRTAEPEVGGGYL
jgi:hypothetical protein